MANMVNLGKFRGEDAKINGVNTLTIKGGSGVHVSQSGTEMTITGDGFQEHVDDKHNPHQVTKAQLGLGNVENKSEATIIQDCKASLMPSDIESALGYMPADTRDLVTKEWINSTIGAAIAPKQDKLAGPAGWLVGFDTDNTPIPMKVNTNIDNAMVRDSVNPVQSRVIQAALAEKQNKLPEGETGRILAYDQDGSLIASKFQREYLERDLGFHIASQESQSIISRALEATQSEVRNLEARSVIHDNDITELQGTTTATSSLLNTTMGTVAEHNTQIGDLINTTRQHTSKLNTIDGELTGHSSIILTLTNDVEHLQNNKADKVDEYILTVTFHTQEDSIYDPDLVPASFSVSVRAHDEFRFTVPQIPNAKTLVYSPTDGQRVFAIHGIMSGNTHVDIYYVNNPETAPLTITFSASTSLPSRANFTPPSTMIMDVKVGSRFVFVPPVVKYSGSDTTRIACSSQVVTGVMTAEGITVDVVYDFIAHRLTS